MNLTDKLTILWPSILVLFLAYNVKDSTIEFKKDTRHFKEEILINHGFDYSEIHSLLYY
jgi:hypothetical protein